MMRTFSNLAISIDGRIADVDRGSKPLGTPYDREMMQKIRAQCDLILVGAGTLRAHPKTMRLKGKLPAKRKQPANAIITASGKLDPKWAFWDDDSITRLVFTTKKGLPEALKGSKDRALVFECGASSVDFVKVFRHLREMNFENVLVEGGGQIMHQVLEARLLQEMYVTLTPRVLGGRKDPSIVDGDSTLWSRLELLKSKKVGDELYLHYKVKGARKRV